MFPNRAAMDVLGGVLVIFGELLTPDNLDNKPIPELFHGKYKSITIQPNQVVQAVRAVSDNGAIASTLCNGLGQVLA